MQLIINNPYRIVGLLVGATAAEQRRQITRLHRFIEAEQEPDEDYSFPLLGRIHRTIESVNEASSRLNLDSDKMNAALFWFYKGNAITDEPALDALKEGDQQSCIEIWTKLTSTGEVTPRSCSAFQNLSTLMLCNAFDSSTVHPTYLEQGIALKIKFLESSFFGDFQSLATDETYKPTKKELQLLFLNQVQSEIDRNGGITTGKFLEIVKKQEFSSKEDFLKGFIQKPIEQIERKVEESRVNRKSNKANAIQIGNALYKDTHDGLTLLKSILGTSNLKFSSVSDKVSDEILQCGIDYFSYYKNSNTDPASASMDLLRKAKTLAIGNIAIQRCQENTENLQEWIDDKPEREKQKQVIQDLERIKSLIDDYENKTETVANARQLLLSARPHLNNIKSVLGSNDELYLGLSTRIASDAQGMCVSDVNRLQEKFSTAYDSATKLVVIVSLKEKVDEAYEVITTIGKMDLVQEFRRRNETNRDSLSNLKNQLANVTNNRQKAPEQPSEGFPTWLKWVIGIIIYIVIMKTCK